VGFNLRRIRQQRGLSRADLTRALDVPVERITCFERGFARINPAHLQAMAIVLGGKRSPSPFLPSLI
jgi:transcriptional regulator with XRE-family HTH domain